MENKMKYTKREMTRTSVVVELPNDEIKSIVFTCASDMIDDSFVLTALIDMTTCIHYLEDYGEICFYEDNEDESQD